jgi:hypothetical protein
MSSTAGLPGFIQKEPVGCQNVCSRCRFTQIQPGHYLLVVGLYGEAGNDVWLQRWGKLESICGHPGKKHLKNDMIHCYLEFAHRGQKS